MTRHRMVICAAASVAVLASAVFGVHLFGLPNEARFGINHFGFLVDDQDKKLEALSDMLSVTLRPDDRPFAEYRVHDPEGNKFDLSQSKGWEVDFDKWDNVA